MLSDPDLEPSGIDARELAEPHAQVRPTPAERIVALVEVVLCSDYPTQLALDAVLVSAGVSRTATDGGLSLQYVVALSLIDTVCLVGLILLFLRAHGERPRDVFLGLKPVGHEVMIGAALTLAAFGIAIVVLGTLLQYAPQLHTVENNPLKDLMRRPRDAAVFAVVVVIAGGIREEIQRAFLLHRFERWLGGGAFGLVATSAVFGIGHLPQGVDATVATAFLGAFWGLVYLRRRSAVAPMVSHSGFNLVQLAQYLIVGR